MLFWLATVVSSFGPLQALLLKTSHFHKNLAASWFGNLYMRAAAFLSPVLSHSGARRRACCWIAPTLPLLEAAHVSEWEAPEAFREFLLNGSLDA